MENISEDVQVMLGRISSELGLYSYSTSFLGVFILDGGANYVAYAVPSSRNAREIEISIYSRSNIKYGERLREKCILNGYTDTSVELATETSVSAWEELTAHFLHSLYGGKRRVWSSINVFFEEGGWLLLIFGVFLIALFVAGYSRWYWGFVAGAGLLAFFIKLHCISVGKLKMRGKVI